MSGRDTILGNIRNSLEAGSDTADSLRTQAAQHRIETHPRGVIPDFSAKVRRSAMVFFCQRVLASGASVKKVATYARAGQEIEKYLRQNNLPQRLRTGTDKRIARLGFGGKKGPEILTGPSRGDDVVCLSHAQGGVIETGTLILTSGPANPTTLNFLPDCHIIVVHRKDVRNSYEGIWKTLRRKFGKGKLPRTVNMITGPSRSADIEQKLIMGAHGPLSVHVIVVDEGG